MILKWTVLLTSSCSIFVSASHPPMPPSLAFVKNINGKSRETGFRTRRPRGASTFIALPASNRNHDERINNNNIHRDIMNEGVDMNKSLNLNIMLQKCKSISAALLTAGVLFHGSLSIEPQQIDGYQHEWWNNLHVTSSQISFHPPNANAIFDDSENSFTEAQKAEIRKRQQRATVLDEVWNLVNKYSLDSTHNGQDWNAVREQYETKLSLKPEDGSYDDDEAMALATSMVKSLGDKYSRILDRGAYSRIQKFDLIGVGATLMPESTLADSDENSNLIKGSKRIMVGAPPVKGSEADKAGIKYGDIIVAVNGVKTEGRTAFEIIDQIGENPNADTITMTVLTQGPDDLKNEGYVRDLTMKRQFVEVKDPVSYKITERRKNADGKTTVVGYVRVSEFNSLVKPKLENALKSLKADGANAYVMDLRSNPGGAFQSAVEIAGLFLDNQEIATGVVDANDVEMPFRVTKGKMIIDAKETPLVIWIDGGSASASEVLAGALHDQCRAVVMGSNSFGKGLIQAVYGLKNGTGLVLTVAKYVTPNGTNIQGTGIHPDVEAKLPPLLIPGISSDTSKVNFMDASSRLSQCTCPITES